MTSQPAGKGLQALIDKPSGYQHGNPKEDVSGSPHRAVRGDRRLHHHRRSYAATTITGTALFPDRFHRLFPRFGPNILNVVSVLIEQLLL